MTPAGAPTTEPASVPDRIKQAEDDVMRCLDNLRATVGSDALRAWCDIASSSFHVVAEEGDRLRSALARAEAGT